jgi:hypothetical protein
LITLHYEGKDMLRDGDLEGYGRIQKQIDEIINTLEQ